MLEVENIVASDTVQNPLDTLLNRHSFYFCFIDEETEKPERLN